jgi:hypothetical protein
MKYLLSQIGHTFNKIIQAKRGIHITGVHCISGEGGEGLFRFDWGASESFKFFLDKALGSRTLK